MAKTKVSRLTGRSDQTAVVYTFEAAQPGESGRGGEGCWFVAFAVSQSYVVDAAALPVTIGSCCCVSYTSEADRDTERGQKERRRVRTGTVAYGSILAASRASGLCSSLRQRLCFRLCDESDKTEREKRRKRENEERERERETNLN